VGPGILAGGKTRPACRCTNRESRLRFQHGGAGCEADDCRRTHWQKGDAWSGGLQMYFTEKNTNRRAMSFSSDGFNKFAESEEKINQPYDEAYISVFVFDDETNYVEHNELLSSYDVAQIIGIVAGALSTQTVIEKSEVHKRTSDFYCSACSSKLFPCDETVISHIPHNTPKYCNSKS
jgi:hypothetical protein